MHDKRRFALCALLISLVPTLANAQVYTITDLGPLSPTAINIWGQVVGNLNGQAFIWTQFGGQKGLGILTGGTYSYAASINNLGAVTGTADGPFTIIPDPQTGLPNLKCSELSQPFVWAQKRGMQGLGTIIQLIDDQAQFYSSWCDISFNGEGINARGQVVGYTLPYFSYQWGLLWTKANGMTAFGGSWPPTFANRISNTGQLVGQNSDNALEGIGHATSWKNGVATDLGSLGGGPDVDYGSSANGVNDWGQIVGWSTTSAMSCCFVSSPVHAVLWTPSGAISDLGTLPGDTSSAAVKTNFFGQVVGSSGNTVYVSDDQNQDAPFEVIGRPFIWTQRSGMQDLNTLIAANSGWVLNSATGINIWGQIVGSGTRNGQSHGFLLTPKKL